MGVLSRTKDKSAAGPDGVSWRLLKTIKGTAFGKVVLGDIGLWASPKEGVRVPKATREMTMVMIPKPGKDHTEVKGWRPIVLSKLGEKLKAEDLQAIEELCHDRSFAGREGRGASDSVMSMDKLRKETGGDDHGRDIPSAFNSIDRGIMCELLADYPDR